MRRSLLLSLVLVICWPLVACTKGEECDVCTTDEDCKGGFVCSQFEDGSRRCGSGVGATTCRVP
jgi:hypothetical protein